MPVTGVGANPSTVNVSFSIAGSATSGTTITGSISAFGPFVPAQTSIVVPPTQRWYFYNVSTTNGATGPDGKVQILLNGDLQYFQPYLSQTSLAVLRGYTFPQVVRARPNTTLTVILTLSEANSLTTAVTQNVNFDIIKYQIAVT